MKGIALSNINEHTKSLEHFFKIIQQDPRDSEALTGMGVGFGNLGEYKESLHYLERAESENPDSIVIKNYKRFVEDVIKIMLLSMKKIQNNKKYDIFNVGTNRSVTINYLYSLIKNKLGSKSKFKKRKLDKFDPKKSSGTFKKLNKFLNLKKSFFTKLEGGIQKTIGY